MVRSPRCRPRLEPRAVLVAVGRGVTEGARSCVRLLLAARRGALEHRALPAVHALDALVEGRLVEALIATRRRTVVLARGAVVARRAHELGDAVVEPSLLREVEVEWLEALSARRICCEGFDVEEVLARRRGGAPAHAASGVLQLARGAHGLGRERRGLEARVASRIGSRARHLLARAAWRRRDGPVARRRRGELRAIGAAGAEPAALRVEEAPGLAHLIGVAASLAVLRVARRRALLVLAGEASRAGRARLAAEAAGGVEIAVLADRVCVTASLAGLGAARRLALLALVHLPEARAVLALQAVEGRTPWSPGRPLAVAVRVAAAAAVAGVAGRTDALRADAHLAGRRAAPRHA